jgi:signal transduction histidine kinase/DNA-binding response OmpR family regulator
MTTDTTDIFEKAPIGICFVRKHRASLDIIQANPAFIKVAGGPIEGKTLDEFATTREAKNFCKSLKSPTPPHSAILPMDGQWLKILVREETDHFILYLMMISDLKAEIRQAEALAETKSNFLATMSHEMRTPMQSVFGLLEMIEMENPPADIQAMARTAKQSASSLLEILDSVLDFAKMDADQMELDYFEVPVRTLCRGVIEALEVKLQGRGVVLSDDVHQDVPSVVVGDPKRLRQILINLAGNAIKFTKEGTITLRVSTDTAYITPPQNGIGLRFEIIDTGIGMSAEATQKLFQPFSQADNSTARKYGGTGLGLSISKKLVELMGGRIGVESIEGKGSTFWFEIPTEPVDTDAQILDLPKLDGISILSVEAHPLAAREIQKTLRSMGATVEHCTTMHDALSLIRRRPFDVGIFDQSLPDGEGIELIRQTMDIRPFMGLILYTARDDIGLQHTLSTLGVTYLTKPASRIGLGEAVQDAATKVHQMEEGGGPRRLIIAEDTASVRDVLKRQLDKLGVEATFVENGIQALDAVRSGEYGILFTDLHMPGMDGYDVVRAIRSDDQTLKRHFPIIALTADVQMAQRQVYMEHGFDECLLKPVSLGHFKRLLIRWGLLKDGQAMSTKGQENENPATLRSIDRQAIIAQMGDFDDDAITMLKLFIDMSDSLITELSVAAKAQDMDMLVETAHSLKGAALSAGAIKLGKMAAAIQEHAEYGTFDPDMLTTVLDEYNIVKQEIEAL